MTRATPITALLLVALSGCGAVTGTQVTTAATATAAAVAADGTDPMTDLTAAIDLYGIAKGIAEQGGTADPSLLPAVTAATAVGDAALATAQTLLSDGATPPDVAATLVKLLKAQAQSLTLTAAPAVTVVPNQAAAS